MTDSGDQRIHEAVQLTIHRAKHLRGQKGEVLTSYAKVEFDGKQLGDTAKVESSGEIDAEYNFTTSFDCNVSDEQNTFDDIAAKPILVSIIEVLPKEKKQKEEKMAVLGQCSIDLLQILSNTTKHFSCTLDLHPTLPMDTNPAEHVKAEVDISVQVNEPLLDLRHLNQSNILTIRVGSLYSLPDAWATIGSQYNYAVGLPVPVNAEMDTSTLFANGSFKLPSDREAAKRRMKWHSIPNANSNAHYIASNLLQKLPLEEEKGDFSSPAFSDFRSEAENEKCRVTWDVEKRCFLGNEAKTELQTRIAQTRLWPVEVMRTTAAHAKGIVGQTGGAGGKKDKGSSDDDGSISYHGIAYVDLAPLLYPGVNSVTGVFKIHGFNENELHEKVKRKSAIAECVARAQSSTSRGTGVSPVQKGKSQGGKESTPSKKGSAVKHSESSVEVTEASVNVEGNAYREAQSHLHLEFSLARPLVPRREPEDLASHVREYIPPHPSLKRVVGGAEKAVEDFGAQLSSVATMVLDEFRETFDPGSIQQDAEQYPEMQQERRKQLIYQLNSSGKYFAFKEQLKHSIVKIVREKYMKTTAFQDKDELQQFISELYVYLVDEMHSSLQKILSVESVDDSHSASTVDLTQLKLFAQEAEVNDDLEMASKYYQERLSINDQKPEHWFDFGTFNLLAGDNSKAKECFRESIALQQTYVDGLLMYGIMCTLEENYDEAETILERAVSLEDSVSPLAWTILALFYDVQGNDIRAEHSFCEATRVNQNINIAKEKSQLSDVTNASSGNATQSLLGTDVDGAGTVTTGAESASKVPGSAKSGSTVRGGKLKKDNSTRVRSSAENSVSSREPDPKSTESVEIVREAKQQPAAPAETPPPSEGIFLQAAKWLLDRKALKFAEKSLSHELLAPSGGPSAEYYIAYARMNMMRKSYKEARENLEHAISLNNEHPDAWSLKGHLHYVSSSFLEARDCYERTLAFVVDASETHAIYLRLASIYLQEQQFEKAKRTFLLACKHSPTCLSWLGVGIACYRLGEITEAEDALAEANVLNNTNAEVWAYLSLVCLQTSRKLEAEQSYKYALKLGIKDQVVLDEIHDLQRQVGFGNPVF